MSHIVTAVTHANVLIKTFRLPCTVQLAAEQDARHGWTCWCLWYAEVPDLAPFDPCNETRVVLPTLPSRGPTVNLWDPADRAGKKSITGSRDLRCQRDICWYHRQHDTLIPQQQTKAPVQAQHVGVAREHCSMARLLLASWLQQTLLLDACISIP